LLGFICSVLLCQVAPAGKRINFLYKVDEGITEERNSDYGIYIAGIARFANVALHGCDRPPFGLSELAAFPQQVIMDARQVKAKLTAALTAKARAGATSGIKAHYALINELLSLKHSSLPAADIKRLAYIYDRLHSTAIAHPFLFFCRMLRSLKEKRAGLLAESSNT